VIDQPTDSLKGNPFKRRRVWWIEPGAIILMLVLLTIGVALEYEVYHLRYTNVLIIFGVFWLILMSLALMLYKRSQYEVGSYSDRSVVDKTKEDLDRHRRETLQKFHATESEILNRGEKTTVLDAWRLEPVYRDRHRYFSQIELSEIDPASREFRLRIQVGEDVGAKADVGRLKTSLLADILQFLKLMSRDSDLEAIARFFETIILEIYSLKTDELNRDVPYSFLSLEMKKSNLLKVASGGRVTLDQLRKMCDVRFDSGRPIEPHRGLEAHGSRGAK